MVPVPAVLSLLITGIRLSGLNGGDPSGCLYNVLPLENKHMEAPSSRCALCTMSSPLLKACLEHEGMGAIHVTSEKTRNPAVRGWTSHW